MRAVLRDHAHGGASLHFRYDPDAIDALKAHGWRWDPDGRFWWARPHLVDDGLDSMALLGYVVKDERSRASGDDPRSGSTHGSAGTGPVAPVVDRTTYYERYLARIPAEDQQAAYRRLMAAFHPDRYGDEEEAKAINAAWDRLRGRNRRGA